jgi:hypothetical protein
MPHCSLCPVTIPQPLHPLPPPAPHASKVSPKSIVVSCSKGILNGTLETVEELLLRVLPPAVHPRLAFLSGPSFAKEVREWTAGCHSLVPALIELLSSVTQTPLSSYTPRDTQHTHYTHHTTHTTPHHKPLPQVAQGLPTMVTVAARDEGVATEVQHVLSTPLFRCYRTTDVVGEWAGLVGARQSGVLWGVIQTKPAVLSRYSSSGCIECTLSLTPRPPRPPHHLAWRPPPPKASRWAAP